MADDYCNGLSVVPLGANHFMLSPSANTADHPWRGLYQERRECPPTAWTKMPSIDRPPCEYTRHAQLLAPPPSSDAALGTRYATYNYRVKREVELPETIRLCDVEAFRKSTAEKALRVERNWISAIFGLFTSFSSSRRVIYRYIGVVKDSFALLEAIHFELFMPDRPDLRFLAVSLSTVPARTVGGDYFFISDVDLLPNPSFGVKLGRTLYPVLFAAKLAQKVVDGRTTNVGLTYVVKKGAGTADGEVVAVGEICDRDFSIAGAFPEHSLVDVTSRDILPAHLYPVEPPLKQRPGVSPITALLGWLWALIFGARALPFDYLTRVSGVHTCSQRAGRVVTAFVPSASDAARIEDRLGAFTGYGQPGDLQLMRTLFGLGCVFRSHASSRADAQDVGETRVDESVILKTLADPSIGAVAECRPLLDCIYGRRGWYSSSAPGALLRLGDLTLNAAQSHALRLYADASGPRVFCVRSPPGSGKTTVASVMAAAVALAHKANPRAPGSAGVQLLLSVQNVAVDNMGAALKKMDYGGGMVYNMKSTKRLDPHAPAPFDFFDLMSKERLKDWKTGNQSMEKRVWNARNRSATMERFASYEECLDHYRREYEKTINPRIILSTVELVLYKMLNPSRARDVLNEVRRVIIDEASLLTEAALYAIIRRFPKARIVLIGDEKQLPPFMYDKKILGHELAGRPALSVAMKNGNVPIVELNEVYRAPPTMVAPYNRLAYGGRLVSKKAEGERPLSSIGLIHSGLPQLLLIDVDGKEERNGKTMSLCNTKEIDVVLRLLRKFPTQWAKDVMIICLYKEQKWRLHNKLKNQDHLKQCSVLTVDSAQGKEAPIVILMTTRTQRANDFFCSTERCTVSISRQQKALIILGKASLLTTNAPWSTVVNGDDFTRIKADQIK